MNNSIIIGGNMSKIIKSKNNSNVYFFNNISIPSRDIIDNRPQPGDIIDSRPQPGDIITCPDGNNALVDELGNYYCDIDPNGNGLLPFTDVDCVNGSNTIVNINGNIIGGCKPANGSFVTCLAGFTAPVENGAWSCAQGAGDEGLLLDYYTGFNEGGRNAITLISTIIPENNETAILSYFIGQYFSIQEKIFVRRQTNAVSRINFNIQGTNILQNARNLENRRIRIEMVFISTKDTEQLNGHFFIVYLYQVIFETQLESIASFKINLDGLSFTAGQEMIFTKPIWVSRINIDSLFATSVVLGSNRDSGLIELTGNVIIRVHDVPN